MNNMCDPCFKVVGPIEELTLGKLRRITGHIECAYCGRTLTQEDWEISHFIGESTHPSRLRTLNENLDLAGEIFAAIERVRPIKSLTITRMPGGALYSDMREE